MLLGRAGHKAGDINQADQWDIKGIAEANKPGRLNRGININNSGQIVRLLGDNAHRPAIKSGKTDNYIGGKLPLYLHKVPIISDADY